MIGEPLIFGNVYSSAPWGGGWIRSLFARTDAPDVCSESWEISGHPYGMSVVRVGQFAGQTLAELTRGFGVSLVGTKAPDSSNFPLLIKLLDARRSLSVQVHPNEKNAALTGGEPKTEAWVVLAAAPGASLYAGVNDGTDADEFVAAAKQGEALVGMMNRHLVKAGDVLYIPGGVVHAIGAGCLIFEVQQSSNSTYRLYDWDRVDAYGKSRPLHIDAAMKSIDFNFPPVHKHAAKDEIREGENVWRTYVRSPKFVVRELLLADRLTAKLDGSTFVSAFVLDGALKVSSGGISRHIIRGSSVLVPADAGECELEADIAGTRLIVTSLV